jgi:hypothetical protein
MKWTTTTLFLLAYCARGFELTERRDKMRPIFTETRGSENHERPRRPIPRFRGANHDANRVRKPCANPLRETGNHAESARDFRAFPLFALSITSVCGGATFSQALMFSSPLLLLRRKRRRKRKRKRIAIESPVESWKTPQKPSTKPKQQKPKPSGLGKRKQCKGQSTRRQNGRRSQEKRKAKTCGQVTHSHTYHSIESCSTTSAATVALSILAGAWWNTGLTRSGAVAMATNRPSEPRTSVRNTRRNSQKSTAWTGHAETKCLMNYQRRT